MKHHFRSGRRAVRALALALILAVVPIPGFAADGPQPVAKPLTASLERAAASEKPVAAQATPAAAPTGSALNSPSFFKSKVGAVVLGVFAAGVGYAAYSLSHDRVHSTTR